VQRHTKKATLKLAEISVTEAKRLVDEIPDRHFPSEEAAKEYPRKVQHELDVAKAKIEIQSGELKEVELKIKYAKLRLEKMKAVVNEKAKDKAVQAAVAVMGVTGFGGIQLLAGVSEIQQSNKPAASISKIAVFNMAAVMKDYGKAKYQVYLLTEERKELTAEVASMRTEIAKLQMRILLEKNQATKEELEEQKVELGREVEDKARKVDKHLNEKASKVISDLYDEIKAVVDETAKMKGYDIVFAYPDATGPDLSTPYVKELKLKPPAAQPFFVAKHVDLSDEIVEKLNARHPAPSVPHTPASGFNPNPFK
jgi:Skp family chaperone for outer membrane proteins